MHSLIRLNPKTQVQVQYSTRRILKTLRPFIENVHGSLASGRSFESSIQDGLKVCPAAGDHFVINSGRLQDDFSLQPQYLFPDWHIDAIRFMDGNRLVAVNLQDHDHTVICEIRQLLRGLAAGVRSLPGEPELGEDAYRLFRALLDDGLLQVDPAQLGPSERQASRPGIKRLQHASLLFQSKTTRLIVDPHLQSHYDGIGDPRVGGASMSNEVDGVLISHFHEDHWHISTLMMFPLHIPIIVPRVPRSSIICADMAGMLRSLGYTNVLTPEWGDAPILIGDIAVNVLPFYGEQPLRYAMSKDADIRNWGNTYLVQTPDFNAWFLIDSGADAQGSMVELAADVRRRFGAVDFVLSNLRSFAIVGPLYINGGLNWLSLSGKQVAELPTMRGHYITLGPAAVADVCAAVDARCFLPYAHWWSDVGTMPVDPDNEWCAEEALLMVLRQHLRTVGSRTDIVRWNIGDVVRYSGGRPSIERHFEESL